MKSFEYPMASEMKNKSSFFIGFVSIFLVTCGGTGTVFGQNPGASFSRSQTSVSSRENEIGVASTRTTSPQMRGQNPSLLDNISFIFKKDNNNNNDATANPNVTNTTGHANMRKAPAPVAPFRTAMTAAENANGIKTMKRRPFAESLEMNKAAKSPALIAEENPITVETKTEEKDVLGKEVPFGEQVSQFITEAPSLDDELPIVQEEGEDLSSLSNEELLAKGDQSFNENDKEMAEKYYSERVARSQAQNGMEEALVPVYHRLGKLAKDDKEFQKAQDYFVLAIKSDPSKNPEITFDYAQALYESGKYERAQKIFTYLLEHHPEMDGPRYHLGLCLMNTNPGEEALACLEETVGREKACQMIAEKSRELGQEETAQKMEEILKSLRPDVDVVNLATLEEDEMAPISVSDKMNDVALGSPEDHDNTLENLGLNQDQTTHVNSPVINLETLGPKRVMVGQESEYKIVVENKSGQSAGNLTVRTDIPNGVEITGVSPSSGTSRISENETADGRMVCLWNLGNFETKRKETLIFKFTPRVRNNIDFTTSYDYNKSILQSGIEVTEPVLELAIEGNETIEWGAEEKYRMKIHNAGDGAAQNVRLTVSTGDNENATRIIKSLGPGEEKSLEINLKTVLDGTLVIRAAAEADYGFGVDAEKSVDILRGRLDLFVEVPEIQFVNETADYVLHVCNTGRANLTDVEVVAAIPTSIEVIAMTGNAVRNNATNQLIWKIPSIKPEEEIVYQVNAKMLRAGNSRFDVTAADKTGVSGSGDAQVQIEAIATLEMKINKPSGAIALGKEVEYEVVISNSGTKAAEQIDAGFFLPTGMTPIAVEGGGMVIPEESKVLFNKINFLGPGQTVAYKVRAMAEERGNHKVQAVLESKADNVQLVTEEMNFFYDKKPTLAKRDAKAQPDRVAMVPQTTQRPVPSDERPEAAPAELPTLPESEATNISPANLRQPTLELPANLPGPRTIRN